MKLRDLAREVGVHPSTVSRVLSGDPAARLSEATRTRIQELAAARGYRPNRLARSLKMRRTHILGMLIPDVTNPFFSVLFRAVEEAAGAAGYNVILCNTDDTTERLEQHLRMLGEGHVDGLLIATAHRADHSIAALNERGIPYVLVNRRRDDVGDSWVICDDLLGARLAVDHLVGLGHVRIGHISGAADISTTAARETGFREALTAHGLALDERLIVAGGLAYELGARGMERLLGVPRSARATAVLVANDFAAVGAIAAARAAGVRVPDDISIVGYNDIPMARWTQPPLTTVRVPLREVGRAATEILIHRLTPDSSQDSGPTQVLLPVELVVRESTAPLRMPIWDTEPGESPKLRAKPRSASRPAIPPGGRNGS